MAAVRKAEQRDLDFLLTYDRHIAPQELQSVVAMGRMLVLEAESGIIGWLRWNLFWDNTPFMTMLYLLEGARSGPWETAGFPMGSTDESAGIFTRHDLHPV